MRIEYTCEDGSLTLACWPSMARNLRVEPVPYLMKLSAFCRQKGLGPESGLYERALAALAT